MNKKRLALIFALMLIFINCCGFTSSDYYATSSKDKAITSMMSVYNYNYDYGDLSRFNNMDYPNYAVYAFGDYVFVTFTDANICYLRQQHISFFDYEWNTFHSVTYKIKGGEQYYITTGTSITSQKITYNGKKYKGYLALGLAAKNIKLIDTNMTLFTSIEVKYNGSPFTTLPSSYDYYISDYDDGVDDFIFNLTDYNPKNQIDYSGSSYSGSTTDFKLTQFTLNPVADSRYYSNLGCILNYALNDSAYNQFKDNKGKLWVNYTYSIRLREVNSNKVYAMQNISIPCIYELKGKSGSERVDLLGLLANNLSLFKTDAELYRNCISALSGQSVTGYSVTERSESSNNLVDGLTFPFSIKNITVTSGSYVGTYVFETFTLSAKGRVTDGKLSNNQSTNIMSASCNLISKSNNSYELVGSDFNSLEPDTTTVINNKNYYTYDDDTKKYRYTNPEINTEIDAGEDGFVEMGDIVINISVDTGGSGAPGGDMIQNVTFPDSIVVNIQHCLEDHGYEFPFVIEDDDLTDLSLREDLLDGFGLIDDSLTPEKNDGYIAMVSDTFSGLDPRFKSLIMFSLSTTMGVYILRALIRR